MTMFFYPIGPGRLCGDTYCIEALKEQGVEEPPSQVETPETVDEAMTPVPVDAALFLTEYLGC
jgi:hypothetical protein